MSRLIVRHERAPAVEVVLIGSSALPWEVIVAVTGDLISKDSKHEAGLICFNSMYIETAIGICCSLILLHVSFE